MRALVVEDDSNVRYWLGTKLQANGHQCLLVDSGEEALAALGREVFDIMVLDRMLPGIDGMEVLQRLRGCQRPPVIILSTIDQPSDRVAGLRAGADDYLGKPFDFAELLTRMELLTRRTVYSSRDDQYWIIQDLHIDLVNRVVKRDQRTIELTDKEFQLLRVLAEHTGQAVPRSMLLEKVWGLQFDPQTNLIDVHMSKLRGKLDKGFETSLIKTVRALGYVLG